MQVSSENASADYFVPVSVPSIQQSNITSFITREAAIRAEILTVEYKMCPWAFLI